MENKVSPKHAAYASVNIIIATSLVTGHMYNIAKNEAWLVIVTGLAAGFLIMLIYIGLAARYPGLSVVGINDAVFGPIVGKAVSLLYIYFFFSLAALNVNMLAHFVSLFVLPNTPAVFSLVLFVFVSAWGVRKGGANILKYSAAIALTCISVILVNTLLLIPNIDIKKLLPFFALPWQNYAVGTHSAAMIPLCDPFALMMFLPVVKNQERFGAAMAKGLLAGGLMMLLIVVRNIVVLGEIADAYSFPSMVAIRQINVGDVLTRIDTIYVSIHLVMIFYKVTVLFYVSVRGAREVLGLDSGKYLVNIFGALLVVYGMTVFRSSAEHQKWLSDGASQVHHTFFVVVLPALTLVTAAFRGLVKTAPPPQSKAS